MLELFGHFCATNSVVVIIWVDVFFFIIFDMLVVVYELMCLMLVERVTVL
jgi:hypothetical protein